MSSNHLSEALQDPVTSQARLEIVHRLWPGTPGASPTSPRKTSIDWKAYFAYYTRECNNALFDEGKHVWTRTHEDLLYVAELLNTEAAIDEIIPKLQQRLTKGRPWEEKERMLMGSIRLATCVLAMVNAGPRPYEISGQHSIPWTSHGLIDAVHAHFNEYPSDDIESTLLGSDVTARNIDRVAKIGIIWTDNLVDHLRLVERDKKLCIFHHASFLRHMENIQSPMYPEGFVKETLDTLTLIFPSTDRKCRLWLEGEMNSDPDLTRIDVGLLHVGSFKIGHASRRLENFRFWRDRLGALKEAVEEATPPSKALLQALNDRKQSDRWLNSWVAIVAIGLTLFFGLVQSIEGAIQVYKSYHPATD